MRALSPPLLQEEKGKGGEKGDEKDLKILLIFLSERRLREIGPASNFPRGKKGGISKTTIPRGKGEMKKL